MNPAYNMQTRPYCPRDYQIRNERVERKKQFPKLHNQSTTIASKHFQSNRRGYLGKVSNRWETEYDNNYQFYSTNPPKYVRRYEKNFDMFSRYRDAQMPFSLVTEGEENGAGTIFPGEEDDDLSSIHENINEFEDDYQRYPKKVESRKRSEWEPEGLVSNVVNSDHKQNKRRSIRRRGKQGQGGKKKDEKSRNDIIASESFFGHRNPVTKIKVKKKKKKRQVEEISPSRNERFDKKKRKGKKKKIISVATERGQLPERNQNSNMKLKELERNYENTVRSMREQRPAFCNYGWGNKNNQINRNHLKTFNVKVSRNSQIMDSTLPRRKMGGEGYYGWREFFPERDENGKSYNSVRNQMPNGVEMYRDDIQSKMLAEEKWRKRLEKTMNAKQRNINNGKKMKQRIGRRNSVSTINEMVRGGGNDGYYEEPRRELSFNVPKYRTKKEEFFNRSLPERKILSQQQRGRSRTQNRESYLPESRFFTEQENKEIKVYKFIPQDRKYSEWDPRCYHNLPQSFTEYIKPAGVSTTFSRDNVATLFNQFE